MPNGEGPKVFRFTLTLRPKKPEAHMEKIPSKEAVLSVIAQAFEGKEPKVHRELFDGKGLVLLEARKETAPGEVTEYRYMRRGTHGMGGAEKQNASASNDIQIAYYQDDIPVGGTTYAIYNEETGTWRVLE